MSTGIMIAGTSIETLSAQMQDAVFGRRDEGIPAIAALDLINVVFALLDELEEILRDADNRKFPEGLPNRWESLT